MSKVTSMRDAVAATGPRRRRRRHRRLHAPDLLRRGHEIIRQRKRDLTLARLTPDLIYDQMVAAGTARKLVFSWLGNPGVGGLHAIRRRVEDADPAPLELEEYSHFGMVGALHGRRLEPAVLPAAVATSRRICRRRTR